MKKLPLALIYSRVVLAILIASLALTQIENHEIYISVFMIVALVTDIFDGIIARKLGVSNQRLRVLDSSVDQFFWIVTIAAIVWLRFDFFKVNAFWILLVVGLEALAYLWSYLKFSKPIATHSILSKVWVVTLLIFLVHLVIHGRSNWPFWICISLGVISRLEIIGIIMWLKEWATDVPFIWNVPALNRGESIKRNSLFNG